MFRVKEKVQDEQGSQGYETLDQKEATNRGRDKRVISQEQWKLRPEDRSEDQQRSGGKPRTLHGIKSSAAVW